MAGHCKAHLHHGHRLSRMIPSSRFSLRPRRCRPSPLTSPQFPRSAHKQATWSRAWRYHFELGGKMGAGCDSFAQPSTQKTAHLYSAVPSHGFGGSGSYRYQPWCPSAPFEAQTSKPTSEVLAVITQGLSCKLLPEHLSMGIKQTPASTSQGWKLPAERHCARHGPFFAAQKPACE